jgi:membrane peptidoglycan carboxypeptidase
MRKITNWFQRRSPAGKQLCRYFILLSVLTIIFTCWPVKQEIDTHTRYSTAIRASDGTLLAYKPDSGNPLGVCTPLIQFNEENIAVFEPLWEREDPRFWYQCSLLKGSSITDNFFGVSGRNIFFKGGSTIDQQMLKNQAHPEMLHPGNRTVGSKAGEMLAAVKLAIAFSTLEILQCYVNSITFLAHRYAGVELNALNYFEVSKISELNPYERYVLARSVRGLRTGGIKYDSLPGWPRSRIDSLFADSYRSMLIANGRKTAEDLQQMLRYPLRFRKTRLQLHNKDYFWNLVSVLDEINRPKGAQLITSLEQRVVQSVDLAVKQYATQNRRLIKAGNNVLEASVVVTDMNTGNITGTNSIPLNMVLSDTSFSVQNQLNTNAPVASLIKPLLIAIGLELGILHENSMLMDQYRGRIHNYSDHYHGLVSLYTLVQKSLNTPLDNFSGRDQLVRELERKLTLAFGNELKPLPADNNPSQYVIGQSRELKAAQLAAFYRAILTDGIVYQPKLFRKVIGTTSFPFDTIFSVQPQAVRIFSPRVCTIMRRLLAAPLATGGTLAGVSNLLRNKNGVMGKTGTSHQYEYGYCILANQQRLVVVSMRYLSLVQKNRRILPVPTRSGAGSAGVLAAIIFNKL